MFHLSKFLPLKDRRSDDDDDVVDLTIEQRQHYQNADALEEYRQPRNSPHDYARYPSVHDGEDERRDQPDFYYYQQHHNHHNNNGSNGELGDQKHLVAGPQKFDFTEDSATNNNNNSRRRWSDSVKSVGKSLRKLSTKGMSPANAQNNNNNNSNGGAPPHSPGGKKAKSPRKASKHEGGSSGGSSSHHHHHVDAGYKLEDSSPGPQSPGRTTPKTALRGLRQRLSTIAKSGGSSNSGSNNGRPDEAAMGNGANNNNYVDFVPLAGGSRSTSFELHPLS